MLPMHKMPVVLTHSSQQSVGESEAKKPRRSERIQASQGNGTPIRQEQLPSPITHRESTGTDEISGLSTPPSQVNSRRTNPTSSPGPPLSLGLSSPPSDTQPFSQFIYPPNNVSYEVQDEEGEGVWGYLLPLDGSAGTTPLVLRNRHACPAADTKPPPKRTKGKVMKESFEKEEEEYEQRKIEGIAAGGYLIGRHPECGTCSMFIKY
jgi:serine/threonine-protein kinase CHEK2